MSVVAAFDLGFRNDASAAAVVRRIGHRYTLIGHLEQRPKKGAPLQPTAVLSAIAELCTRHGCASAWGDLHYSETAREQLANRGISFNVAPAGQTGKLEVWGKAKELIIEGKVATPNLPALFAQLKLVRSKAQSGGGTSLQQPRKQGSHGDLASAFALALWAASQHVELPTGSLYTGAPMHNKYMLPNSLQGEPMVWHADDWDDDDDVQIPHARNKFLL